MRQVQITLPPKHRAAVFALLDERGFDYTVTAGDDPNADYSVVSTTVPSSAVEGFLEELSEAGLPTDNSTVVTSTEFVKSKHSSELQRRHAGSPEALAPTAVESKAWNLQRNTLQYLWMMALSAVMVVAGLLIGSPAIVVGATVTTPIVNPAIATSVGIARSERPLVRYGLLKQAAGTVVALAVGALFAAIVRVGYFFPPTVPVSTIEFVGFRQVPGFLALAVALAAGAIAAYALITKHSVTLVGVASAAALIPAIGAAAIGMAWLEPALAVGALSLYALNLLGINLAGYAVLRYQGYDAGKPKSTLLPRETGSQLGWSIAVLLVVAVVIGGTAAVTYRQTAFEREATAAVVSGLDQPEYEELTLRGVSVTYDYALPAIDPKTVTVTVGQTANRRYPSLAAALDRRIETETGDEIVVEVRTVEFDRSEQAEARNQFRTERETDGGGSSDDAGRFGSDRQPFLRPGRSFYSYPRVMK